MKAATFISRTKLSPLDIHIKGFSAEDFSGDFLLLLSNHIGHCRKLHISGGDLEGLTRVLQCISSLPVPLLSSIRLSTEDEVEFHEQIFPSGAPRLTTVYLDGPCLFTIHQCLSAFRSVTFFRLENIGIEPKDGGRYIAFRDCLMAMPSLNHLELDFEFFEVSQSALPITLPALRFLLVDPESCGILLSCVQAASLATLSIAACDEDGDVFDILDELEIRYPSLKHLILTNVIVPSDRSDNFPDLRVFAGKFPDVERLTCLVIAENGFYNIEYFSASILFGSRDARIAYGKVTPQWPKLQTMAIKSDHMHGLNACRLERVILKLREVRHPIRQFMLPIKSLSQLSDKDRTKVGRLVELKEFAIDWPTPFLPED
ncbi:hypothetical protein HWV62_29479 [Athelia sp. TMB]|nr:hypothetical protein HWV62_29479 [Athelia sp. TMB]